MRKIISAVVGVVVVASVTSAGGIAAHASPSGGFTRTEVARGTAVLPIAIDTNTERTTDVVTQEVAIAPGASSGWHVHPGWELVTIKSGVLTIYAEDHPGCAPLFLGPGMTATANGRPHLARNDGANAVDLVVTYFNVPMHSGAAASPAGRPGNCPDVPGATSTPGFVRAPLARGGAAPILLDAAQGKDVVTQEVTIQPGASSGWHVHPGWELVTVKSGVLTVYAEDHPGCAPLSLGPGMTATANGRPHLARNDGSTPVDLIVWYFDVPMGTGAAASEVARPSNCPDV